MFLFIVCVCVHISDHNVHHDSQCPHLSPEDARILEDDLVYTSFRGLRTFSEAVDVCSRLPGHRVPIFKTKKNRRAMDQLHRMDSKNESFPVFVFCKIKETFFLQALNRPCSPLLVDEGTHLVAMI